MPLNDITGSVNTSFSTAPSTCSTGPNSSAPPCSKPSKPPERRKPDPKARPLEETTAPNSEQIKKRRNKYSKQDKVHALKFLFHHRIEEEKQRYQANGSSLVHRKLEGQAEWVWSEIPDPDGRPSRWLVKRGPTLLEASKFLKIPERNLSDWWSKRVQIFTGDGETHKAGREPVWPELEQALHDDFVDRRAKAMPVNVHWIRNRSRAIFRRLYPDCADAFKFSMGWFHGFTARWHIKFRTVAKVAT